MKKPVLNFALIITLLIIIDPLDLKPQPVWTMATPTPQENWINDIKRLPGTDRIMAVCNKSTIMTSEDAGISWNITRNPAGYDNNFDIHRIYFLNANTGFLLGSGRRILKTENGGLDWETVYDSGINNLQYYRDIAFCNDSTGFAVGDGSILLETTDGGNNWSVVETGFDLFFTAIAFCNPDKGYITGAAGDHIVKTTDGGATWELTGFNLTSEYADLTDICFINETTGFITGEVYGSTSYGGHIFKTIDSGETWTEVYTDDWNMPHSIDFVDENNGIVGCNRIMYESAALTTHDGGSTWTQNVLPGSILMSAEAVCCYDPDLSFAGGHMGMLFKSTDSGISWEALFSREFFGNIYEVLFLDQDIGFAMAINGSGGVTSSDLFKTSDGGSTWSICESFIDLGAFDFVDENLGFMINNFNGSIVLRTTDGGVNWSMINTAFNFGPLAIRFFDPNTGIIAGESKIIKSTDSGFTWEEIYSPTGSILFYDIEFLSESEFYIAGGGEFTDNFLLHTVDGGNSWAENDLGNWGTSMDLFIMNDSIGFLACEDNAILKSTDGFETWYETVINSPHPIHFRSVVFPSANTGYAVGDSSYETIVKTTDGGETWNSLEMITTSGLNQVYFKDDLNGLVFGDNGVVLKTTTGGTTGFEERQATSGVDLFTAYPNPFDTRLDLFISEEIKEPHNVTIYNSFGQLVRNYILNDLQNPATLNLEDLQSGIYLLNLQSGTKTVSRKIIKTQ